MKKVYKQAAYAFGWNDPRGGGDREKPAPSHMRLVGDLETGMIDEYENRYMHGATNETGRILEV